MKHTLVALLQDQPGVLNRAVSLFRRRGFNIESLTVGQSETPGISRMTLVVEGDDRTVEQVTKQLYKLIDVLKVSDVAAANAVVRELMLVKVNAPANKRSDLMQLADIFGARVADVTPETLLLELCDASDHLDRFQELLTSYGIRELVRTGQVAMGRGQSVISAPRREVQAA